MELRQLNLNMIIMIKKSFLFVFVFMLSCSSNNSKQEISIDDRSKIISIQEDKLRKEIKENSGILIPNYTLIESNTEEAMGDYAENYVLKFDAEDFKKIISQIEKSSYYTNIVNPNTALKEGKLKRWSKADFGYKFEYFMDGTNKLILYEVNTSNYTIYSVYAEE